MKEVNIEALKFNPFTMIGKEWCLIGARNKDRFNAMTASWGGVGVIWNKNIITIYVRPQRYTREFIDASEHFTVSFFDSSYKKALGIYGSKSGRDINKEKETGLTRVDDNEYSYLKEAKLVFECKKVYRGNIDPTGILMSEDDVKNYPEKDYHIIYMGEITKVLEDHNESDN